MWDCKVQSPAVVPGCPLPEAVLAHRRHPHSEIQRPMRTPIRVPHAADRPRVGLYVRQPQPPALSQAELLIRSGGREFVSGRALAPHAQRVDRSSADSHYGVEKAPSAAMLRAPFRFGQVWASLLLSLVPLGSSPLRGAMPPASTGPESSAGSESGC